MDKLWFARRAFLKLSKSITSITDGSAESLLFQSIYEQSLKVTIEDTAGKEFEAPYRPSLVYNLTDPKNPYSNKDPDTPQSPFYIYKKDLKVLGFADQQIETPEFSFSESFRSPNGIKYYPFYDTESDQNLIASQQQPLQIKILAFKKNLTLWTAKALEAAICFAAYLLSPEVDREKGKDSQQLRDYGMLVDQYKIYNTVPGNYQSPIPKYSPLSPQNLQSFNTIPGLTDLG